jgi:hypothetical protein
MYAAFRELDPSRYGEPEYRLDGELSGVQWADWSLDGGLLVATVDGRLQVRDGEKVRWEVDLADDVPDPQPPPAEAAGWGPPEPRDGAGGTPR